MPPLIQYFSHAPMWLHVVSVQSAASLVLFAVQVLMSRNESTCPHSTTTLRLFLWMRVSLILSENSHQKPADLISYSVADSRNICSCKDIIISRSVLVKFFNLSGKWNSILVILDCKGSSLVTEQFSHLQPKIQNSNSH